MPAENAVLFTVGTFGAVILLLACGVWVGVAIGAVGFVVLFFFAGARFAELVAAVQLTYVSTFTYTAIPLFIFMAEIVYLGGLGAKLYRGANSWVSFLPGGLLCTNIVGGSMFAAISGSSMAGTVTIGTLASEEMIKRGYSRRLTLGSICAGGSLGILIPPSVSMIIYGAFVQESVARLFMAGVFPGIALSGIFVLYIVIAVLIRPGLAPERLRLSLRAMVSSLSDLWPVLLLILAVMGTIYLGIATPTEAAAIGALVALLLCTVYRTLTWTVLKEALLETVRLSCSIMIIIIGATLLGTGLAMLGVPGRVTEVVVSFAANRVIVILFSITVLYILLGMLMDGVSMMLLTLPVTYPIMMALGFDPVWFGVIMILYIEIGQLTPPVGLVLYALDAVTGRKYTSDIMIGIIPFVFCQVVMVVILIAFPILALWLPSQMFQW